MIKEDRKFDHKAYWLDRHEKYRGDWRSIGRLALTDEENRAGHNRLIHDVGRATEALFPDSAGRLKVLDLACGVGRLAPLFLDRGDDYFGVDISPVAIEQAKRGYPEGNFTVGSITDFRDNVKKFDLAIASYVMVHMVDLTDWLAALRTLKENCDRSGAILILDTIPAGEPDKLSSYALRRSMNDYLVGAAAMQLRFTEEISYLGLKEYHVLRHA